MSKLAKSTKSAAPKASARPTWETLRDAVVKTVKATESRIGAARDAIAKATAERFAAMCRFAHDTGTAPAPAYLQSAWAEAGATLSIESAKVYASEVGQAARLSAAGVPLPEAMMGADSKASATKELKAAIKAAKLEKPQGAKTKAADPSKATSPDKASPAERAASRAMLQDVSHQLAALAKRCAADPIARGVIAAIIAEGETKARAMIGAIDEANAKDAAGKAE